MRRLICVFVVRIWHKTHLLMLLNIRPHGPSRTMSIMSLFIFYGNIFQSSILLFVCLLGFVHITIRVLSWQWHVIILYAYGSCCMRTGGWTYNLKYLSCSKWQLHAKCARNIIFKKWQNLWKMCSVETERKSTNEVAALNYAYVRNNSCL